MVLDKSQGITEHNIIYPEGNMNIWTKFYGNSSNNCWDISLKSRNVSLIVAWQEKVSESAKIMWIYHLGTMKVCTVCVSECRWVKQFEFPSEVFHFLFVCIENIKTQSSFQVVAVDISAGMSQEIWAKGQIWVRMILQPDQTKPDQTVFPETLPHPLQHDIICLVRDAAGRSPTKAHCDLVVSERWRGELSGLLYLPQNIKQTLYQLYLRTLSHSFSGVSWAFQLCLSKSTAAGASHKVRVPYNTWITALWISVYQCLNCVELNAFLKMNVYHRHMKKRHALINIFILLTSQ